MSVYALPEPAWIALRAALTKPTSLNKRRAQAAAVCAATITTDPQEPLAMHMALVHRAAQDPDRAVLDGVLDLLVQITDRRHEPMLRPSTWLNETAKEMLSGSLGLSWSDLQSALVDQPPTKSIHSDLLARVLINTLEKKIVPPSMNDALTQLITAGWGKTISQSRSSNRDRWELAAAQHLKRLSATATPTPQFRGFVDSVSDMLAQHPSLATTSSWNNRLTHTAVQILSTPTPDPISQISHLCAAQGVRAPNPNAGWMDVVMKGLGQRARLTSGLTTTVIDATALEAVTAHWMACGPTKAQVRVVLHTTRPYALQDQCDPACLRIRNLLWKHLGPGAMTKDLLEALHDKDAFRADELAAILPPEVVAQVMHKHIKTLLAPIPNVRLAWERTELQDQTSSKHRVQPRRKM